MNAPSASPDLATAAQAKPYRLGLLFVHGIGDQPRGDTLWAMADPLVRGLDKWLFGAARQQARQIGLKALEKWANGLAQAQAQAQAQAPAAGPAMGRLEERVRALVRAAERDAKGKPWSASTDADSGFRSGAVELTSGRMPCGDGDANAPAHAVLRVHTIDADYVSHEGEALLAEGWWASSFVPPTAGSLLRWTEVAPSV